MTGYVCTRSVTAAQFEWFNCYQNLYDQSWEYCLRVKIHKIRIPSAIVLEVRQKVGLISVHIWRPCDRASLMYSFKYNQQDAASYNILYCCQCSACFRRFLRPSSGAQNCTHIFWYMSSLLAVTASGSSKQAWHMPDAMCTFLAPDDGRRNRLKHVIKNIL
jgi:hypothetical protein